VAPRFLIDENLSPMLALHLRATHGFDAVHVNAVGLRGERRPIRVWPCCGTRSDDSSR
jgi:predicted nuclease of predicted toxin-antitoxin system